MSSGHCCPGGAPASRAAVGDGTLQTCPLEAELFSCGPAQCAHLVLPEAVRLPVPCRNCTNAQWQIKAHGSQLCLGKLLCHSPLGFSTLSDVFQFYRALSPVPIDGAVLTWPLPAWMS